MRKDDNEESPCVGSNRLVKQPDIESRNKSISLVLSAALLFETSLCARLGTPNRIKVLAVICADPFFFLKHLSPMPQKLF
jgi:hypothetical protein